jgi:hypothetical protein
MSALTEGLRVIGRDSEAAGSLSTKADALVNEALDLVKCQGWGAKVAAPADISSWGVHSDFDAPVLSLTNRTRALVGNKGETDDFGHIRIDPDRGIVTAFIPKGMDIDQAQHIRLMGGVLQNSFDHQLPAFLNPPKVIDWQNPGAVRDMFNGLHAYFSGEPEGWNAGSNYFYRKLGGLNPKSTALLSKLHENDVLPYDYVKMI